MNDFDRYKSISERFKQEIPQANFMELIKKLDVLYGIQMEHKKEPNFYRDLYSKDWNKVISEEELKMLVGECNEFSTETRTKSYADLIKPINEYIKENKLDLVVDRKKINEDIPVLSNVLDIQNEEIEELNLLLEKQKSQIPNKTDDKKIELSKSNLASFAKQEEVSLEVEDALEDMQQLEKTYEIEQENSQSLE